MQVNCCANCEHRKFVGYYAYDACFAQEIKDMFEGYDGVSGQPCYQKENCCITVREYYCQTNWFEPKKSFMDKLICLFKGE